MAGIESITDELIGKKVLVCLGYDRNYGDCNIYPRTEEQLVEQFKEDIEKFFSPKKDEE